jgi:hypothetical protein
MLSDEQIYYNLSSHIKESAGLADRYWDLPLEQRLLVSDLIETCAKQFKDHILLDKDICTDLLLDSLAMIKDATDDIDQVRNRINSFNEKE